MRWLYGITDSRHEFEQGLRDGYGQGSLVCGSPWVCKESDMTEQLNNKMSVVARFKRSQFRHWIFSHRTKAKNVDLSPTGKDCFGKYSYLSTGTYSIQVGMYVSMHIYWYPLYAALTA